MSTFVNYIIDNNMNDIDPTGEFDIMNDIDFTGEFEKNNINIQTRYFNQDSDFTLDDKVITELEDINLQQMKIS